MNLLPILTIFTVLNTIFIILNIVLISYYKYWANKKDIEYKALIVGMDSDSKTILSELKNTKGIIENLYTDIKNKLTT